LRHGLSRWRSRAPKPTEDNFESRHESLEAGGGSFDAIPRPALTSPTLSPGRHSLRLLLGALVLMLAVWGCGALAKAYAGGIDLAAVRAVAAMRAPVLTAAAHVVSFVGSSYIVFPLAVLISVTLFLRRARISAAIVILSTFAAAVIESVDKAVVGRPRPPVHHLELVTSASFPSGHATQSTAFYGSLLLIALTQLRWKRRLLLSALAALLVAAIGFSRVYLGVHYPTDVAAGLLLGGSWTALVTRELNCQPAHQARGQPRLG
jgi:undecaprenyl-diphosphatase